MQCRYYDTLANGSVRCLLCPHACVIAAGQTGLCRSRMNKRGELISLAYGRPCAIADDPIEKKPLAEWHPGTRCLSNISQVSPQDVPSYDCTPEEIVGLALNHHLPTIAYTYTEPLTWYEYVYDTASLAREKGLYNVLVSAGYIQEAPLRALAPLLDAANIDLKSFSDETYRKFNKASLEPVLRTLLILHEMNVHLEITLLLFRCIRWKPQRLRLSLTCEKLSRSLRRKAWLTSILGIYDY